MAQLVGRHAQQGAVDDGHPVQRPVPGEAGDEGVDLVLVPGDAGDHVGGEGLGGHDELFQHAAHGLAPLGLGLVQQRQRPLPRFAA